MSRLEPRSRLDYPNDDGAAALPEPPNQETIGESDFERAFGESLANALDIDTWEPGENLADLYGRLGREIEEAVKQEVRIRDRVREHVFPRLQARLGAPRGAGVYQATVDQIERVHRCLLFNGAVEACDGTSVMHDTLPITIAQIGVSLVSYHGDQGTWVQRLYRRDLRVGGLDPVEEAMEVLNRRGQRGGYDTDNKRDKLSDLARRGIMTYAERAVLLHKSEAAWRMGHGNPAPYELLTGSGMPDLVDNSLGLLEDLILKHRKFVFVPSAPSDRVLLTIGDALLPLQYAIVDTMQEGIERISSGHYRGAWEGLGERVGEFAKEVGSKVVIGIFRASAMSPAHVFYAHAEHAHQAALIAMADAALQEHRGFPMLIDLADRVCAATFGAESLIAPAQVAYADSGQPFRYLTERQTRR